MAHHDGFVETDALDRIKPDPRRFESAQTTFERSLRSRDCGDNKRVALRLVLTAADSGVSPDEIIAAATLLKAHLEG